MTIENDNYCDISSDVMSKAALDLKDGDYYRDGNFLNAILDMIKCINDDIAKDELAELREFFQNENGLKIKASILREGLWLTLMRN